jgi:hypothetical protein
MTSPRQHAPKATAPGVDLASRGTPTLWTPPLQPAPVYKNPLRALLRTHTIPSNLPDILSSFCSLSFVVASNAGELLDAVGATASGLRWRSERREVDEEKLGVLFCFTPSSSPSSTPTLIPEPFPCTEMVRLVPCSARKTMAYRFG